MTAPHFDSYFLTCLKRFPFFRMLAGYFCLRMRGLPRMLALVWLATLPALPAQEGLVVSPVAGADGYAIDSNGDGAGDAKVLGTKVKDLPIGKVDDRTETRAWIPFKLTEAEKAAVAGGNSVTLRLFLTAKSEEQKLRVDLCGVGYRDALSVQQGDFSTMRKMIVGNVICADTMTGACDIDVTDFVREEVSRGDTPGFAFLLQASDKTRPATAGAFKIGSSARPVDERPALIISKKPRVKNPSDPGIEDPQALRVLILGNSILLNGPMLKKGWAGNWGMAASKPETDFAHLLMQRIQSSVKRPVVFKLHNIAFWERNWSALRNDMPIVTYARDFNPDIILSCIAENTGLHDDQVAAYAQKYEKMVEAIAGGSDGKRHADVIVRTSFWKINPNTDLALSQVADRRGWPCIKCSDLCETGANLAKEVDYPLGPEPVDPGVRAHPSDAGMKAIADRIWDNALSDLLKRKYATGSAHND